MGNSFLDIYLNNPSEASSLPYWKSLIVTIPSGMRIVKDDEYNKKDYPDGWPHERQSAPSARQPRRVRSADESDRR